MYNYDASFSALSIYIIPYMESAEIPRARCGFWGFLLRRVGSTARKPRALLVFVSCSSTWQGGRGQAIWFLPGGLRLLAGLSACLPAGGPMFWRGFCLGGAVLSRVGRQSGRCVRASPFGRPRQAGSLTRCASLRASASWDIVCVAVLVCRLAARLWSWRCLRGAGVALPTFKP